MFHREYRGVEKVSYLSYIYVQNWKKLKVNVKNCTFLTSEKFQSGLAAVLETSKLKICSSNVNGKINLELNFRKIISDLRLTFKLFKHR